MREVRHGAASAAAAAAALAMVTGLLAFLGWQR